MIERLCTADQHGSVGFRGQISSINGRAQMYDRGSEIPPAQRERTLIHIIQATRHDGQRGEHTSYTDG
jgi:hypothetical protein